MGEIQRQTKSAMKYADITLSLELVRGCPYECGICRPPHDLNFMEKDILLYVLATLKDNGITRDGANVSLRLYGWGESSTHPNLVDFVYTIRAKLPEAHLVLSTNAINPEVLVESENAIDRFVLGLDSLDNDVHMQTRGWPNTNTLHALNRLSDHSKITLTSLCHRGNMTDVRTISEVFHLDHAIKPFTLDQVGRSMSIQKVEPIRLDELKWLTNAGYNTVWWTRKDALRTGYELLVEFDGTLVRCLTNWDTRPAFPLDTLAQYLRDEEIPPAHCGECDSCAIGVAKRIVAHG